MHLIHKLTETKSKFGRTKWAAKIMGVMLFRVIYSLVRFEEYRLSGLCRERQLANGRFRGKKIIS